MRFLYSTLSPDMLSLHLAKKGVQLFSSRECFCKGLANMFENDVTEKITFVK